MRVLVLGGSGFVGQTIVRGLAPHYDVMAPTSSELDLTDIQAVTRFFYRYRNITIDAVVNCAANTDSDMCQFFDVQKFQHNVKIISNLLLVKANFGRLINFGSGAEFDRNTNIFNANEADIWSHMPSDHYGLSKNITSRMVNCTLHCYTLRLFGTFGPGEHQNRLLKKVLRGEPLDVMNRAFDYFYVEDIVPVVRYFLEQPVPLFRDVNLTYQLAAQDRFLESLISKFCAIHGIRNPAQIIDARPMHHYTGNGNRLQQLGIPLVGLERGLEEYR